MIKQAIFTPEYQFIHKYHGIIPNDKIMQFCFIDDDGILKPKNDNSGWLRIYTGINDFFDNKIYDGDVLECLAHKYNKNSDNYIIAKYHNIVEFWCGGSGVGFRVKGGRFTKMLSTNYIYNKKAVVIDNRFESPEYVK